MKKIIKTFAPAIASIAAILTVFMLFAMIVFFSNKKDNDAKWLDGTVIIGDVNIIKQTDGLRRTSVRGATYELSDRKNLVFDRRMNTWMISGHKRGSNIFISTSAYRNVEFPDYLSYTDLEKGDTIIVEGPNITLHKSNKEHRYQPSS